MTKEAENPKEVPSNEGVLATLRKLKAEKNQPVTTTMPESGMVVHYPGFVSHRTIMGVYKKSGGQKGTQKMASIAISELCRFGDEQVKISPTDVAELLPNRDVTFLSGKCLGVEQDDDDDEGNDLDA